MSQLTVAPEMLSVAASDLAGIGAKITAANTAAATLTTNLQAAAADEVSAALATFFGAHALQYQDLGTQLANFHDRFVRALSAAGGSYAATDTLNAVNAQTMALLGRPLIGNGADATTPGGNGRPAGLLYGNGGAGAAGRPGQAGGNGGAG
ncbi:PE family protein, partial [Mycobacterium szulgai]|uniref:PE family protein n=1 Tax=Mycobacterium szulgai TaxID=1787 RepID=UPI0021F2D36A